MGNFTYKKGISIVKGVKGEGNIQYISNIYYPPLFTYGIGVNEQRKDVLVVMDNKDFVLDEELFEQNAKVYQTRPLKAMRYKKWYGKRMDALYI